MKYKKVKTKLIARQAAWERLPDADKKACKYPGSQNRHKN